MAVYRPKYRDPKSGEMLEAETWWCDFTYQRRRIRESTGQVKKTLAKAYEENRKRELENAIAGVARAKSADRIKDVKTVIGEWLDVRSAGKKERTAAYLRERCAHLVQHLGAKLACDITEAEVARYIGTRESEKAAAASINREVFLLSRALRIDRATAWPELGRSKRKSEPVGKAITEAEQQAILSAARANRSKYALPFIATALFTGFRASEVRTLRWRQVDFLNDWIRSEQSKTPAGKYREVLLLPELKRILLEHRAWIEKKLKTAPEPDHCIFPFANRGKPVDPTRPCTNIASAWWQIREDAGVTMRLHDLRHTFVTKLVESGAPDAVVREIVGHADKNVIQRYTHLGRDAKREAIERAFRKSSEEHVKESPKVEAPGPVPAEQGDSDNLFSIQ